MSCEFKPAMGIGNHAFHSSKLTAEASALLGLGFRLRFCFGDLGFRLPFFAEFYRVQRSELGDLELHMRRNHLLKDLGCSHVSGFMV